ncbi:MAG: NYN domain-containing protein [Corynebacterium sp.]|nr:NYN domain-containing protein [Corynebacterium sp.]
MLERTQIYVDTSYLLASFYNAWNAGARSQLDIDLPAVVDRLKVMAENQFEQRVHRQLWYDGIPDTGPHRYQRTLRNCDGVQMRTGHLIEAGERRTQKAVDTRLVADMVIASLKGQCSDIILVSGDADMIPGVEEAIAAGVRVHLYGFGWDSMSAALRHRCDTVTILDPREDFQDTMELHPLEGPIPPANYVAPSDSDEEDAAEATEADEAISTEAAVIVAEEPTQQVEETPAQSPVAADPQETVAKEPAQEQTQEQQTQQQQTEPQRTQVTVTETSVSTTSVTVTEETPRPRPNPSMMAPRRKLQSHFVPVPNELWISAGFHTPFDVGQQYATWWYHNVATSEQRDSAHLLSGGGLPPEIDRPLLQFACEMLNEYTLTENQRVGLRDGFHSGIRTILMNPPQG